MKTKTHSHFLTVLLSRCLWLLAVCLVLQPAQGADAITETFQKALFEEEANQNYDAAIRAYSEVVGKLDDQRRLAATALFRLGECYRKLGRTNDAAAQYQRLLVGFPDQTNLLTLCRQNLRGLGVPLETVAARPTPQLPPEEQAKLKELLQQELRIAEQFLAEQKQKVKVGVLAAGEEARFERDVLGLKRQLLAVEGLSNPDVRSRWRALLLEEIALAEKAAQLEKVKLDNGKSVPGEVARLQRDVLAVKRELVTFDASPDGAALGAGPAGVVDTANVSDEEEKEIRRIRALIQDSPDLINARNQATGLAPLHEAAMKGYSRVVRFLLESGADPILKASSNNNGKTALSLAVGGGHKAVVELLLASKADPNIRDSSGKSPLHVAARQGYRLIVERLLAAGLDVNARDNFGLTPLHEAVGAGHQFVVELLSQKGADVNLPATKTYPTPNGYNILEGWTPLHTALGATANPQPFLVEWLCQHGADVNAVAGPERVAPLRLAAERNSSQAIRILLKAGAAIDAVDANDRTALYWAVAGRQIEAAAVLLEAGANPNGPRGADQSLLELACRNSDLLKLVLAHKPDLEVTNRFRVTALVALCTADPYFTNLVSLLLEAGANPNVTGYDANTPLHYAALNARPDLAALLLKHGADVNALNPNGQTPLALARFDGNSRRAPARIEQTVALLLTSGADDTLQRRNVIGVTRRGRDFERGVFYKGTNGFNRHSLFEFIATVYDGIGVAHQLPFPDLEHLSINRLAGRGQTFVTNINLLGRVADGRCAGDLWLEWGDTVEIPETEHPLPATWVGFPKSFWEPVRECLSRKVSIIVKGRTNVYDLQAQVSTWPFAGQSVVGQITPEQREEARFRVLSFRLNDNLRASGLLLTSSDVSQVRVNRLDPITREPRQWALDTRRASDHVDFWLRDGDMIQVPDLPLGARPNADANSGAPSRRVIPGSGIPLPNPVAVPQAVPSPK